MNNCVTNVECNEFQPQSYLQERCKKCFQLKSKHKDNDATPTLNIKPQNEMHASIFIDRKSIQTTHSPTKPSTSMACPTEESKNDETAINLTPTDTSPSTSSNRNIRPKSTVGLITNEANRVSSATNTNGDSSSLKSSSSFNKKERRRSWRDKNSIPVNCDEGPDFEDTTDSISLASYKTANSKGVSSTKSMESVSSAMDSKSMVTAMSGASDFFRFENEEDRATPTDIADREIIALKKENDRLEDQVQKLKKERQRLTRLRRNNSEENNYNLVEMLEERLMEAETQLQDYRDENSTLKCELHSFQGTLVPYDKMRIYEERCVELTAKNKELVQTVDELHKEIEEMQDQYREEEIDEFRELQRELEQNAKNCRVLQFKLRKSERQRDELLTEKNYLYAKFRELQQINNVMTTSSSTLSASAPTTTDRQNNELISDVALKEIRIRELESELRIAKEVSVRLHNELEAGEDKRYKLEDEIFYYKEKVRELQTENRWKETRNKSEKMMKTEENQVYLNNNEIPKELRDILERETDLRDQLKFTEEDLQRTRMRLKDAENENEELIQKLVRLSDNNTIRTKMGAPTGLFNETNDNRSIEEYNNKSDDSKPEIAHFLSTIQNFEEQNNLLKIRLQEIETINGSLKAQLKSNENRGLTIELRKEKEHRKELESELNGLKQLIAKSENNKLIKMAEKVESLNYQLKALNERYQIHHEQLSKESNIDMKYADELKSRCERLENELSEYKAAEVFNHKQQDSNSVTPSSEEIEQCCALLASIDFQTARISKQLEKMEPNQREERRRSLNKDNYATVVADLAKVTVELNMLHKILDTHKLISAIHDKEKVAGKSDGCDSMKTACNDCILKNDEILTHQKKQKELTNQILQTEDRWTEQMAKTKIEYETQIQKLNDETTQLQTNLREQVRTATTQAIIINEKEKQFEELNANIQQMNAKLNENSKTIQNYERELKSVKEWEIKFKKLEKLFDKEKHKFDAEKARIKTETNTLKKRTDEALSELTRLRDGHQRREILWNEQRSKLEQEILQLRTKFPDDNNSLLIPIKTINYRTAAVAAAAATATMKSDSRTSNNEQLDQLRQRILMLEKKNEELGAQLQNMLVSKHSLESELGENKQAWEREKSNITHKNRQDEKVRNVEFEVLQQKFASRMNIMETSNKSLHSQLVQARRERDYQRESATTIEQKFKMEQKTLENERNKYTILLNKNKDKENKLTEALTSIDRLTMELTLQKETHVADRKLWSVEKKRLLENPKPNNLSVSQSEEEERDQRITEDALTAAENVQKQYAEYQKFCNKEVNRLKIRIKELNNQLVSNESDFHQKAKELTEQIKLLEIDQKNLIQVKEFQMKARETAQLNHDRLMQIIQQTEVQNIANRYKIGLIMEQLNSVIDKRREKKGSIVQHDFDAILLINVINQLNLIKEGDYIMQCPTASGETLSETDTTAPSDNLSQSSISLLSTPLLVHTTANLNNRFTGMNQSATLPSNMRSCSTESNTTLDSRLLDSTARSVSPTKRIPYCVDSIQVLGKLEINNNDIWQQSNKSMTRSISHEKYGEKKYNGITGDNGLLYSAKNTSVYWKTNRSTTLVASDSNLNTKLSNETHSRLNSSGTNVLYKIRREELSKGKNPSVRSLARAFESFGNSNNHTEKSAKNSKGSSSASQLRNLFGIRKSHSVDHEAKKGQHQPDVTPQMKRTMTASMNQIEYTNNGSSTLPHIGRNPFKDMGTRIVERMRRSLSRSSKRDTSQEKTLSIDQQLSSIKNGIDCYDKQSGKSESNQKDHTKFGNKTIKQKI